MDMFRMHWRNFTCQGILTSGLLFAPFHVSAQVDQFPIEADDTVYFPDHYLADLAEARRDLLLENTVYFSGSLNESVPATLLRPRYIPPGAKLPVIMVQYGISGHRTVDYAIFHAAKLALKGFVTIIIDGPGRGDREPLSSSDSAFNHARNYIYDYGRALDYVSQLPYVDADRISYMGISWGGITGLVFAANEPRIKAMMALSAGGRIPALSDDLDPVNHVAKLKNRNLLLINGRFDLIINPFQSMALRNAAPKDAVKVWVNSEHFFVGYDQNKLNDMLSEFVAERVR